jgi:hypothetical protein
LFKNHSIYGKLSFLFLILSLFFLAARVTILYLSEYSFFEMLPFNEGVATIVNICLIVLAICSLVFGLIAIFKKNTAKILPTISLSFISCVLFFAVLFLIQTAFTNYNITMGVITNYGIFEVPNRKLPNGKEKNYFAERYLKVNTDEIPALLGSRFGFNYVINGEPYNGNVEMIRINKYPSPGFKKGNKLVLADSLNISVSLNELKYSGFLFEKENELIPGIWEIELWYNGKMIVTKKFIVFLKPDNAI